MFYSAHQLLWIRLAVYAMVIIAVAAGFMLGRITATDSHRTPVATTERSCNYVHPTGVVECR